MLRLLSPCLGLYCSNDWKLHVNRLLTSTASSDCDFGFLFLKSFLCFWCGFAVCFLQLSPSDALIRRQNKHSDHKKKSKTERSPAVPPHNYKAYQLYTLYRDKDGKIMQARNQIHHQIKRSHFSISAPLKISSSLSMTCVGCTWATSNIF